MEETLEEQCACTDECLGYLTQTCKKIEESNKQETLEEVAKEKYPMFKGESYIGNNKKMLKRAAFINGAKWQQERMYSKEEVELIANEMVNWAIDNIGNPNPQSGRKFDEVIAKFKNK